MIATVAGEKAIFYGGTGQCKVMRPILESMGIRLAAVIDDTEIEPPFDDVPLYKGLDKFLRDIMWQPRSDYKFVVTIGNPHGQTRRDMSTKLIKYGFAHESLIHRTASIEMASIGIGLQAHAYTVVNTHAQVGNFCILNTRSTVEHDDILEDGVELGPSATLCGNVTVGENTWIGAGATVRQGVTIGKNVIVGAGSLVLNDIIEGDIVGGIPAISIRHKVSV